MLAAPRSRRGDGNAATPGVSLQRPDDMASDPSAPDRWKRPLPVAMLAAMAVGGFVHSLLPPGPVELRAIATGLSTGVACLLLLAGLSWLPRRRS